ncbi:MAG: FHA domain-containing protein [Anaerolineae bacterium]|nr:FHA domain-containing protein [Anaerolineae bacterium]
MTVLADLVAVLQSNVRADERYRLVAVKVDIGRSVIGPYDILLPPDDLTVSRNHASLIYEIDHWVLEDHSRNGTRLNQGVVRRNRVPLRNGDRIRIGQHFDVTFMLVGATTDSELPADEVSPGHINGSELFLNEKPPLSIGLWISPNAAVWRDGKHLPIYLSRTEYRLLKHLLQYPGQVREYDDVMRAVWGRERRRDNLHELVYRVRHKIEPDPSNPRYLIIRNGIGLVLFPQGAPEEAL